MKNLTGRAKRKAAHEVEATPQIEQQQLNTYGQSFLDGDNAPEVEVFYAHLQPSQDELKSVLDTLLRYRREESRGSI